MGVCRFYLEPGGCRFGDKCKFTHPRQNTARSEDRREVCRHFLNGRCKFGDNCKFSHSTGDRQGGQEYGGQRGRHQPDPVNRRGAGGGWNQRGGRSNFDLYSNRDDTDSGWSGGHASSGWEQGRQRGHGDRSHGDRSHGDRSRGFGRGNDRYHYSSPDYRRSSQDSQLRGGGGGRGGWGKPNDYQETDYRGEKRELFGRDDSTSDPSDLASLIRKDMEEFTRIMWPFSCYGYSKEMPCVPGLIEMCPDEFRLLAYAAKSAGTSSAFLQSVEEMQKKQADAKHLYANITQEEARKLMLSQPSSQSSGLFGPASSAAVDLGSIFNIAPVVSLFREDTTPALFQQDTTPTLFQQDTMPKAKLLFSPQQSNSTSIFPSPAPAAQQPSAPGSTQSTSVGGGDASDLSPEDLEAFKADKFILGKIPEKAPPLNLCSL